MLTDARNGKIDLIYTKSVSRFARNTAIVLKASRELKDDETSQGVTGTVIALDGIAVIVNSENPVEDIASDMITKIYTGEVTAWDDVK